MNNYEDFWNWFAAEADNFFEVVKAQTNIGTEFLDPLSVRLDALKDGFYFMAGMLEEDRAELVITADGNVPLIVFVEELVAAAPNLKNWTFTALKPPLQLEDVHIQTDSFAFHKDNLFFYDYEDPAYPDLMQIVIIYNDYEEERKSDIDFGVYLFLDNYLGELNALTTIDKLTITGKRQAEKELIPIGKLKDYLIWREKEFVEKYEGAHYDIMDDEYGSFEGELPEGKPRIATMNTTLLSWDGKASHPWIASIFLDYKDGGNGMPDKDAYEWINQFEKDSELQLKARDGYLNIGRQIGGGWCRIDFACKGFRKPSKVLDELQKKYTDKFVEITYEIVKDKYWQVFERFNP